MRITYHPCHIPISCITASHRPNCTLLYTATSHWLIYTLPCREAVFLVSLPPSASSFQDTHITNLVYRINAPTSPHDWMLQLSGWSLEEKPAFTSRRVSSSGENQKVFDTTSCCNPYYTFRQIPDILKGPAFFLQASVLSSVFVLEKNNQCAAILFSIQIHATKPRLEGKIGWLLSRIENQRYDHTCTKGIWQRWLQWD